MNKITIFAGIIAITLAACNGNASKQNKEAHADSEMHSAENGHDHGSTAHSEDQDSDDLQSTAVILDAYLAIKDALVKDDKDAAATAGNKLTKSIEGFDVSRFTEAQQQELKEILEVAKEHGEHIAKSEIDHQREHFQILGKDIKDLVSIAGTDRTLYQQYCPMYNNNEGGMWLSASEEVLNPLFGSKMLKCGSVQETIKSK